MYLSGRPKGLLRSGASSKGPPRGSQSPLRSFCLILKGEGAGRSCCVILEGSGLGFRARVDPFL